MIVSLGFMQFAPYRPPVRLIAFWTIMAWILLLAILIVGAIWDFLNAAWIQRSLWTAMVVTGAILLGCLTILGFAAAEEETQRRRQLEDRHRRDESGDQLHDRLRQAKDSSHRGSKS